MLPQSRCFPALLMLALSVALAGAGCRSGQSGPAAPPSESKQFNNAHGLVLLHEYDGNTLDSSRFNNRGTAYGDPGYVAGCRDLALNLDGLDDFVEVPDSNSLEPDVVSVEVVFTPAQTLTNGTIFQPLVVKLPENWSFGSYVDGYDIAYQDAFGTGGRIGFGIGDRDGRLRVHASAFVTLQAGRSYDVVGTYDLHEIRLYIDGELVASRPHDAPIAYLGGPLWIGGNIRHDLLLPYGSSAFFQGSIDQVAIYNRVLSPDEIERNAVRRAALCNKSAPETARNPTRD